IAKPFRRHSGIFPGRPCLLFLRDTARANAVLADVPDLVLLLAVIDETRPHQTRIDALKTRAGFLSLRVGLHLLVTPELDQQPGASFWQELAAWRVRAFAHEVLDDMSVERFESDRVEAAQFTHLIGRASEIRIAKQQQRSMPRPRDQAQTGGEDDRAGTLG